MLINAKASRVLLGDPAFDMGLAELMLLMVEERSEEWTAEVIMTNPVLWFFDS